jgi:NADPH-dependent curcumin reductase CurA
MSDAQNRRIVLAARPHGAPKPSDFRLEFTPVPQPAEGQVLTRTRWLSLDPYMRGRMSDAKSYAKSLEVGDPIVAGTVGEVVESRAPGFAKGDLVLGYAGWQDYAAEPAASLVKLDPAMPRPSLALGVLGMPGLTAWSGLEEIGKPKSGEALVVAAAAGPVGATVGQIAKLKGCRVVGIAGGTDKCTYLIDELGFDAAIDHRAPDLAGHLAEACPDGIDVYWENVGGAVWSAVFPLLNDFARVPVCGLVAHYNDTAAPAGPDRTAQLMRAVLTKRLTIRGFIVTDFAHHRGAFLRDMQGWVASGAVKVREDVTKGLENAPEAFIGMLAGRNFGKVVVEL